MEQQILARCILDILGAPKEHIEKSLKDHIDQLKKNGLQIQTEVYEDAKPKDKLFSAFAELTIQFKDVNEMLDFCFDSMPSSVEIVSPAQINLDTQMLTEFLNDFQAKMHHTDMMLKGMQAQKQVLDKNAVNILRNFIKYLCKEKPRSKEDLTSFLGIQHDELVSFLDGLVEQGSLKKEGDLYTA